MRHTIVEFGDTLRMVTGGLVILYLRPILVLCELDSPPQVLPFTFVILLREAGLTLQNTSPLALKRLSCALILHLLGVYKYIS